MFSIVDLQFHPQCMRVFYSPHAHQHLLFVDLLMVAFLTCVRGCLMAVLIRIYFPDPLVTLASFHVPVGLLCMSLEKCLTISRARLKCFLN